MSKPDGKIWLIHWEYSDKSGADFVKAFSEENEDAANELLEILKKHGGERQYYCDLVPFQSGGAPIAKESA